MPFKKLEFQSYNEQDMILRSALFLKTMGQRRTIRSFSSQPVPIEIIINAVKTAASAPSGANKQPWTFIIIKAPDVKKRIRLAAEAEEKEFYSHRASESWLEDLNQFGTDWRKPFLEQAPYLIAVFKQTYDLETEDLRKNYYVNESVGIASGFLLAALHNAGLGTLTHTPSPMKFLGEILNRPKNEKAFLLIPVGYPEKNAQVPVLRKKTFEEVSRIV